VTAPRLHLIPAIACDKALVLRRGPTGHVASLLWNRETGDVQLGQWLKGRIFEHRSDLSPDGRHMIIFAGTGLRWWTAISRAPWLTALAFLPQDSTWHGGGAFTPDGRVWLNGGGEIPGGAPDGLKQADLSAYPHATDGFHMGGLYAAMMQRRGWRHTGGEGYEARLEKPLAAGWRLELGFEVGRRNRSIISNRYALLDPAGRPVTGTREWEWAEPWKDGVQFASRGALWFAEVTERGVEKPALLHDFTGMAFEAREAPYRGAAE